MIATSTPAPGRSWHLDDVHELARQHGVDPCHGLNDHEARSRIDQHGPNEIRGRPGRGPWGLLVDQFKDFMIVVLIAAALISGVIGDWVDTLAIVVIVLLNAVIGFVQAWRADRAMAALQQLAAAQATVLRNGQAQVIAASELVPGDIVLLEAGNQVPADLRLIDIAQLKVDESALTGESVTVAKHPSPLTAAASALGDRLNMAFKGTTATHGRGRGLVVATGMATELGKVACLLDRDSDRSTPLQRRLATFGKRLALAVIAICVVIFAVGVLRGESPVLMILTAVSLAVAAIPEALPAVVTMLLALGARRMVSLNALIRRLPSVETLGSVTYICSDKTGTLTQNRMHAELLLADGQRWLPGGEAPGPAHMELLRAAALCNDASRNREGAWQGDPTERPPRPPRESLFAHGLWQHVLFVGLLIGALCLMMQAWALSTGHAHWQTMVFTVLTLSQMAHVMAIRSESESLLRLGLRSNRPLLGAVLLTFALQMATIYVPALNPIFKTEPLDLAELTLCIAACAIVFVAVELEKWWRRRMLVRSPARAALDMPV